ncbi:MAG: hypothetical protein WA173_14250 [Pseudomonas sp.]|uniref:DUF6945 domain-containing protein n=1 Tax=Pseudomonas sp. TaxID=306 RepID=UPI003BB58A0D
MSPLQGYQRAWRLALQDSTKYISPNTGRTINVLTENHKTVYCYMKRKVVEFIPATYYETQQTISQATDVPVQAVAKIIQDFKRNGVFITEPKVNASGCKYSVYHDILDLEVAA